MNIDLLLDKPENLLTEDELQYMITHFNNESAAFTAYEQAVKVTLNSIYGAFGNKWFHFFDIDIAESITLQGQNAILYSEKILNKYFNEFFVKDTELHKHLNITINSQIHKPAVIYIDTDSNYVQFEEMYESIEWKGEKLDIVTFILEIYNFRIKKYIELALQKYANSKNSENFLEFELESVAYAGIWMAKKKYIQELAWDDKLKINERHPKLKKVKVIGFDSIQSSTPTFVRKKLNDALQILFTEKPTVETLTKIVLFLKKTKKEFKMTNIDEISFNRRTNNIEKYIIDDTVEFQFASKCPSNVKAAGYYNFLLNNNPKYKNKYKLIGDGEKLKMYHTVSANEGEMFAYFTGDHPYEIAPSIDYEIQFEKSMLDPLNRVLGASGLQTLNRNLIYSTSLF
jgi:DNA polymerase elongation subunit (family B)